MDSTTYLSGAGLLLVLALLVLLFLIKTEMSRRKGKPDLGKDFKTKSKSLE